MLKLGKAGKKLKKQEYPEALQITVSVLGEPELKEKHIKKASEIFMWQHSFSFSGMKVLRNKNTDIFIINIFSF